MIGEADLEERREHMSLRERVAARAALDRAAGVIYPPLTDTAAATLARLLTRKETDVA